MLTNILWCLGQIFQTSLAIELQAWSSKYPHKNLVEREPGFRYELTIFEMIEAGWSKK